MTLFHDLLASACVKLLNVPNFVQRNQRGIMKEKKTNASMHDHKQGRISNKKNIILWRSDGELMNHIVNM